MAFRRPLSVPCAVAVFHPLWWISLLILLANDRWLKRGGILDPLVTGKLSDFAGMLVAPALLALLTRVRRRCDFIACHLAVAALFTVLKVSDPAAAAFCRLGAAFGLHYEVVADPTDLIALPMLALSVWLFDARRGLDLSSAWRRAVVAAATSVGLFGVIGSSKPPPRAPVVARDVVYVDRYDAYHVLDRATGRQIRTVELDVAFDAVTSDDTLYQPSGASLHAHRRSDGKLVWQTEIGGALRIVHVDSKRLIAYSNTPGGVSAAVLDAATGSVLWRREVSAGSPAVVDDRALFREGDALVWRSLAPGRELARSDVPPDFAGFPIVHHGRVFALDRDRLFEVSAEAALSQARRFEVHALAWASKEHAGEVLLVTSSHDSGTSLRALDTRHFEFRWQLASEELLRATPRVVFTHSNQFSCGGTWGSLAARAADSGKVLWQVPYCGWAMNLGADESTLVLTDDTDVTARDSLSGKVLWTTRLDD
jgi:outer membrane protein assembly factor BamB